MATTAIEHDAQGRTTNGPKNDVRRPMGAASIAGGVRQVRSTTITGYACACDQPIAPTRPAVVLDPFGGTGTVAMVARHLGRYGISMDLSSDYLRLADWRVFESGHAERKAEKAQKAWEKEQRITKLRETIKRQEAVIRVLRASRATQ